jgi:hypothetical protein
MIKTNSLFHSYPHRNFACSRCQEQFTNQTLYSVVTNPVKIPYYSKYCWACAAYYLKKNNQAMPKLNKMKKKPKTKKLTNLPTKMKKTKTNSIEYYNCLLTKAQND